MASGETLWGGVDAGGTAFKCAVADADGQVLRAARIGVGEGPEATLAACADFFTSAPSELGGALRAVGVGCFGPLALDPAAPDYGVILATPKPGWAGVNVRTALQDRLGVPVAIDTDVNATLAAEMRWGAARGAACAAYVTVGAGIGAGIWTNGGFAGRPAHPEFGHIAVRRHPDDTDFPGVCPFHGDCLEGMASAAAIAARFGDPQGLPADHPAWRLAAFYLGQGALSLFLTLRPERIVMGGGLMQAPGLTGAVRGAFQDLLGDYLPGEASAAERLIVAPGLGDQSGVRGGVLLALEAAPPERAGP